MPPNIRLPTHRRTLHCPFPSHPPHVRLPSLLSTPQPFSPREGLHPQYPHSLRHSLTHSVLTRLIRTTVPSHHYLMSLVHRAANREVPSVVSLPPFCT